MLTYIEELTNRVTIFKYGCPCFFTFEVDQYKPRLIFRIGSNRAHLRIDPEISPYDQITLLDRQLRKFYPQYKIETETDVAYDGLEIAEIMQKEGLTFDEVYLRKKRVKVYESAIIEYVWVEDDKFRIRYEEILSDFSLHRETKTRTSKIPVSEFMAELRTLGRDEDKRDFILTESRNPEDAHLPNITVTYSGRRLYQFLRINKEDIKEAPVIKPVDGSMYSIEWSYFKFFVDGNDPCFPEFIQEMPELSQIKESKKQVEDNRH